MGSETYRFAKFRKSSLELVGFVTGLGARNRANLPWDDVLRGGCKKSGLGHLVFYEVSVNYVGFGAGRCSRKPRENPKRGHLFDAFRCAAGSGNLVICSVSMHSDGQNLMFLKGLLENTAWSEVCEGSGALEPDSPRKSMAGGSGERPRAEKHGLESLCTRFGRFC